MLKKEIDNLNNIIYTSVKFNDNPYTLFWFGKAEDEGRTEDPTSKKLEKARGEGQVAKSMELNTAIMILICFSLLYFLFPWIYDNCIRFTVMYLSGQVSTDYLSINNFQSVLIDIFIFALKIVSPVMLTALVVGVICNIAQNGGWLFTTKNLKFDPKKVKLDPKKFFEKVMFSKKVAFDFFKSIGKFLIVSYVVWGILSENFPQMLELINREPFEGAYFVINLSFEIIIKCAIFLLIFSILDYKFQKYEHTENLKMTKQEVKDEHKQMEGDPKVKAKIRQKQREAAQRRMMDDIPTADVVITNPTHLSVAIKYDLDSMDAPLVVAKGAGFLALKIREIAEEHSIPLVENKPLARTLYYTVEIGDEIPVELYKAVAEVLAFAWKLKRKTFNKNSVNV